MKGRRFLLASMWAAVWVGLGVVANGQNLDGGVTNRYIIKLRTEAFVDVKPDQHATVLTGFAAEHGIAPKHIFATVIKGFAGHVPPGLLDKLQNDPLVESVTPDATVTAFGEQVVPNGVWRVGGAPAPEKIYTGIGVGVAVVDTGLDLNHADLAPVIDSYHAYGTSAQDDHGHGTHVAGIIAARNNAIDVVGVAPDATLYAVKVLDSYGYGYDSDIIAGLNWVAENANLSPPIRVVNMSLGRAAIAPANDAPLRAAIQSVVNRGITVVVAAGNDPSKEVKSVAPAGFPEVIAVASTTALPGSFSPPYGYIAGDTASFFTTDGAFDPFTGAGVTISAPGEDQEDVSSDGSVSSVGILSLSLGGGTTTMSGTSMASPHVAGIVALLYQQNASLTPTEAKYKVAAGRRVGMAPFDSKTSEGYMLSGYTFDGVREGIVHATSALLAEPTEKPTAPGNFTASLVPPNAITLAWTDALGETSYEISRSDLSTPITVGANVITYTDAGLALDTTYTYYITARNSVGVSAVVGPVSATTLPPPPPAVAQLVSSDTATLGNWVGNYGLQGYDIIADRYIPNGQIFANVPSHIWAATTTDPRGLESVDKSSRTARCYSSIPFVVGSSFALEVNLWDGLAHKVSLYCVDWDTILRDQTIDVIDYNYNSLLASTRISSFNGGQYLVWIIKGHVTFKISNNSPSGNAVVSGIFIDEPPAPDFSLSVNPSSAAVPTGTPASYNVTVDPLWGFSEDVALSVSSAPAGASGTFNPTTVANGSGSAELSVTAPAGSYSLTIAGTSTSGTTHTASAALVVANAADFSLSVSPSSRTIKRGSSTTYNVTVTPSGGFSGTVGFSVSGLPSNATGTFKPASVKTSGSSKLTITTGSSTPAGNYPLTITGESGLLAHNIGVSLTVTSR